MHDVPFTNPVISLPTHLTQAPQQDHSCIRGRACPLLLVRLVAAA